MGVVLSLAGCLQAELDQADGPVYYRCDDEVGRQCGDGFACADDLIAIQVAGQWVESGLCLPIEQSSCNQQFLQRRAVDGVENLCLLPLHCPAEGGFIAPGDRMVCPLGFRRSGDEADAPCLWDDCNMTRYGTEQANLEGFGALGNLSCVEPIAGPSPFDGLEAARVYCVRKTIAGFSGCPAGWQERQAPEACRAGTGTRYCSHVVAYAGEPGTLTTQQMSSGVLPLVVPPGSAQSCRPLP